MAQNEIKIGDVVRIRKELSDVYFDWGDNEPQSMVVLDILEAHNTLLAQIDMTYKNSDGKSTDLILLTFLEKDIAATRDKSIDDILDEGE